MTSKASLKQFYLLPMTPKLKRLQDEIYQQILGFARFKTGNPVLENLADHLELEELCDASLLVQSGAIKIEYTDSLSDGSAEGILLKLKVS